MPLFGTPNWLETVICFCETLETTMFGLGIASGLRLSLNLGLGLSGGSGNSEQITLNNQRCYNQHLWVLIPKVGNSDNW